MKTSFSLCLALLAAAPGSAQVFRPATVNGAVVGGIAGAVIGHNSGSLNHNAWKGAAIGAGVGAVVGSVVGHDRDGRRDTPVRAAHDHSPYVYRAVPRVAYYGAGSGGFYRAGYDGAGGYYRGSAAADGFSWVGLRAA